MPPKSAAGKPKYSDGEKILCFHGPLLYEAKCLGVEVKEGHIKYFVHYQGWNKNWDEWVGDARIMKFNAVGLQKQKELKEFYSKPGRKVKGLRKSELQNQEYPPPEALRHLEISGEPGDPQQPLPPPPPPPSQQLTPLPSSQLGGSKRARCESVDDSSGLLASAGAGSAGTATTPVGEAAGPGTIGSGGSSGGSKRLRIQIELPRPLKLWLADDADLVGRQRRLHALPPLPAQTVASILGRFVTSQAAEEPERERLSEFVAGVQSYFNAVLSTQLLYAAERQQYSALLKSHRGAMPSSLYGCVHLTRLFVRLGDMLSQTKLDLKCLNSLLDYCDAFLLFLEKNIDAYISAASYETGSA